jgi:hypothetical protein
MTYLVTWRHILLFSKLLLVIYFIAFDFVARNSSHDFCRRLLVILLKLIKCRSAGAHKLQCLLIFSLLQMELTHFLDGGAAKTEERLKLEAFFLDDFVAKVWIIIFTYYFNLQALCKIF